MKNAMKSTTIVFRDPNVPKAVKINLQVAKSLLFISTIIFFVLAGSLLLSIYFYNQKIHSMEANKHLYTAELEKSNEELQEKLKTLESQNSELTHKLTMPASQSEDLYLFAQTSGFQDLTDKQLIKIENLQVDTNTEFVYFRFDIKQNSEASKVSGFIYVLYYTSEKIDIYPDTANFNEDLKYEYHQGESFTVSRFRPVKTRYAMPKNLENTYFKILIFNRKGDMLMNKKYGPLQTQVRTDN
ncbi:MAG: hypothetical protein H6621_10980 [Halobacteriovoraceae bacterium]|nr:hypothetical protein [Halobacteriovoraceae bacterium]